MSENSVSLAQPETPNAAYVYFASCSFFGHLLVKIGKAKDPTKRISMLQVGCPFPMELDFYISCESETEAIRKESFIHEKLKRHRLNGEWFVADNGFNSELEKILDDEYALDA